MPFLTLIDTETLARHIGDDALAIVDCRFKLDDPGWGARDYESRHIPGAVFADLDRDLAGEKTGTNGRHPLPDPAVFARTLGRLGIDDSIQVVAYDQDSGMYASRFWWMLRWMGHDRVAVLDGGFAKWLAENRPTQSGHQARRPRGFTGSPRTEMVADAEDVAAIAARPDWRLIDARAPERFSGQSETIDKKAGHIPGAANHFFRWNLDDRHTLLPQRELRARFDETLKGTPPERVVCYCGSGVTACQNLLALEHAGLRGAKLYPGSWSEWSSDPARPTAPQSTESP
jgi:thiosulfate/3-mercaptopyruvate sulfurtransferase